MKKLALSRRWLFPSVAVVVMASGGGIAVMAASAAEITPSLPHTIEAVHSGRCLSTAGAAGPVTQQACAAGAAGRQAFRLSATTPTPTTTTTSPSASPTATTGPAAPTSGDCARPAGASPQVKVTEVNVGKAVTGYGGEGDTENLPMAIASTPDGGSWLAWLGTDSKVYLGPARLRRQARRHADQLRRDRPAGRAGRRHRRRAAADPPR